MNEDIGGEGRNKVIWSSHYSSFRLLRERHIVSLGYNKTLDESFGYWGGGKPRILPHIPVLPVVQTLTSHLNMFPAFQILVSQVVHKLKSKPILHNILLALFTYRVWGGCPRFLFVWFPIYLELHQIALWSRLILTTSLYSRDPHLHFTDEKIYIQK